MSLKGSFNKVMKDDVLTARRTPRITKQVSDVIKKSITEKAKDPAGVSYI